MFLVTGEGHNESHVNKGSHDRGRIPRGYRNLLRSPNWEVNITILLHPLLPSTPEVQHTLGETFASVDAKSPTSRSPPKMKLITSTPTSAQQASTPVVAVKPVNKRKSQK
ncbi:hypothetical protein CHS0354_020782 [Potamilus streckersoni]|uniref:Uncharacterized protein n=1 Tax=Potamilus streckersoni TaxID=2493646 RepID=A0AAE0SCN5_9BIVA|nr:hypothetical protein CHS0354_020782 [Potamilus streckersoni]